MRKTMRLCVTATVYQRVATVCLSPLPLFALLAFSAPLIAQGYDDQWPTDLIPLRAEEIVINAERDHVLVRGSMDWPNGRTTTSVVIICDGKSRSLIVQDRTEKTDDRWRVDPDLCRFLAGRVQPRT